MDIEYKIISNHYEKCYEQNGDNNKGVDWPNVQDANTRYKVMMNIMDWYKMNNVYREKFSLLDLGCGLAHMYQYICEQNIDVDYTGMDISPVFVDKCKEKYPEQRFICKDILKDDMLEMYDFIVMNGIFTERLSLSYDQMWSFLTQMLTKVYAQCKKGMAFNLMSKDVDWEREDLFHVPLSQISAWLTKNLTRQFIIRYDYGLYEYTVYVMKS